jgi:uncharacterized protein
MIVRTLIAVVLLCGVLVQPVGAADLKDIPTPGLFVIDESSKGLKAYTRGDYATALKIWTEDAGRGVDWSQFSLGFMYDEGKGVLQDYAEAVKWYRKAAEQGLATAQHNLGLMYLNGNGVPQDYILGHMWSNLAAAQGEEAAVKNREFAARKMTPADVSKAQRLAKACLKRKYKRCG